MQSRKMINLQLKVDRRLKDKAEKEAAEQGFNSLLDFFRFITTQMAKGNIDIATMLSPQMPWAITPEKEAEYNADIEDFNNSLNKSSLMKATSPKEIIKSHKQDLLKNLD